MPKRILVVEDDVSLRNSIRMLLVGLDCDVTEAGNGLEAMQALEDDGPFSAVITDMQMPGACGIEVLQHMLGTDTTPPAYVHSSAPTFTFCGRDWQLSQDIEVFFGSFASFRTKGAGMMHDIADFVKSVKKITS